MSDLDSMTDNEVSADLLKLNITLSKAGHLHAVEDAIMLQGVKRLKQNGMDYQNFLIEIDKLDYGIVSFNTYKLGIDFYFYLMVAKKGNAGLFNKIEGKVQHINIILGDFFEVVKKDSVLKEVALG